MAGKRFERGRAIWETGAYRPNGQAGVFYVQSQRNGKCYLAAGDWAKTGPRCTCTDWRNRGGRCKHIWAANLAIAATIAGQYNRAELADRLLHEACKGISLEHTAKWQALWEVVQEGCRQ